MTLLPEFIFTTCQNGAEPILKHEISREWPTFKLAYSRPGFITFKVSPDADVSAGFDLRSVFARAYGISLGKAQGATLTERAMFTAMVARQSLPNKLRLHVWERERNDPAKQPEDEAVEVGQSALAREVERTIRSAQDGLFHDGNMPVDGDLVFSVVIVEEDEWWLGYHLQSRYHRPWPCGIANLKLPPEAPSRAYLKLCEGLAWPGLPIRQGDAAVELGSAPGGASYGLLERGLSVVGVDPADMAPAVVRHPKFRHVRLQAKQVKAEELGPVDWIFSDMNIAPDEAIDAVERLMLGLGSKRLLGALLTLKLTNWTKPDAVPELVRRSMERLLAIGFSRAQSAQLYFNRREVCVAAFTPLGEAKFFPASRHRGNAAKARRTKP